MKIVEEALNGVKVISPSVFTDTRGYFYESYNQKLFNDLIGENIDFVQDNQSLSQKDVLRGLHFQAPPFAQAKLVRVSRGAVLDVAVDIRPNSKSYGQYFACELSERNHLMMWIPEGFAHGFLTLEDNTLFNYKCSNYYQKASEGTIKWDDTSIAINWNVEQPIISEKDKNGTLFSEFISPFK